MITTLNKKTVERFKEIIEKENATYFSGLPNPIKIDGDITYVYCYYKDQRYELIIDTKSLRKLAYRGTVIVKGRQKSNNYYTYIRNDSIHSILMGYVPPKKVVDHINRNTFDNRLSNLRIVTIRENVMNRDGSDNPVNLKFKDNQYQVLLNRRFKNEELAKKALKEATDILNKYREIDIEKFSKTCIRKIE